MTVAAANGDDDSQARILNSQGQWTPSGNDSIEESDTTTNKKECGEQFYRVMSIPIKKYFVQWMIKHPVYPEVPDNFGAWGLLGRSGANIPPAKAGTAFKLQLCCLDMEFELCPVDPLVLSRSDFLRLAWPTVPVKTHPNWVLKAEGDPGGPYRRP